MLKLMYITNNPQIAEIADKAGVDRIFIDLEVIGKADRQGGMDTVQSHHCLNDIAAVKERLHSAELLVRSNPIHPGSRKEIDRIVEEGAEIIMLPFFKTTEEVSQFVDYVGGRSKTMLLFETKEAVEAIDEILDVNGIDELYIGLNDLHLSYSLDFMFQLLADGTVDEIVAKFKKTGKPYGFGGIAKLGGGLLPAEHVISEHYRLGSTRSILSRSFCNCDKIEDLETIRRLFEDGICDIRVLERNLESQPATFFEKNRKYVISAVDNIVSIIHNSKR